ncbi:hypothetical protein D3C87_1741360 [compost metagenome]
MGPHFGEIKRIVRSVLGLLLSHHLNIESPFREILTLNGVVKIFLMTFTSTTDQLLGFIIGKILNALLSFKMKFHPDSLIGFVDQRISMRTKAMHMAIARWNSPIRKQNRYLMNGLGT